ncbi:MAG: DUF5106 domain-containing protein, partial [Sphingobacterium sp.]|nr:DUF5106 domain-containing protein [Sphingobacterium sp.]
KLCHKFMFLSKYGLLIVAFWGMLLLSCTSHRHADPMTFWDRFDFTKIDIRKNEFSLEKLLVDFILSLDDVSSEEAAKALIHTMDAAKETPLAFQFFKDKFYERLYDPKSTLRNDAYYGVVLDYLISSDMSSEADRSKYKALLALVQRNLPGVEANNFSFERSTGEKGDLHSLKGAYKLVFFYAPLCKACKSTMPDLKAIHRLVQRTKKSKMTLLTVCATGRESDWLSYEAELPAEWINGYNKEDEIIRNGLYDLKAFPTFYLIDENNKVLLKDADMERLVGYIGSLS